MNLTRYRAETRARARRRKSPWNLLLFPLSIAGIAVTWLVLAHFIAEFHKSYYPTHSFGQSKSGLGGILMFVPILFPSFAIGFMLANVIIWLIPPARRALDLEAEGVQGASFRTAMKDLAIITAVVLPIALVLAVLGAIHPF